MSELPQALRALADLTPPPPQEEQRLLDVTSGGRPFVWLGFRALPEALFHPRPATDPAAERLRNQRRAARFADQAEAARLRWEVGGGLAPGSTTGWWGTSAARLPAGRRPGPSATEQVRAIVDPLIQQRLSSLRDRQVVVAPVDRQGVEAMAALDQVDPGVDRLQAGWLWLVGTQPGPDGPSTLLHPLVQAPVVVERDAYTPAGGNERQPFTTLRALAEAQLTPLVQGPARQRLGAQGLGDGVALGRFGPPASPLRDDTDASLDEVEAWVRAVVADSPFTAPVVDRSGDDPRRLAHQGRLSVVLGVGLFLTPGHDVLDLGATLRSWAQVVAGNQTWQEARLRRRSYAEVARAQVHALDDLLGIEPDRPLGAGLVTGPTRPTATALELPPELSAAQVLAVARSRTEALTVVTGPPGTGKTRTLAAIAVDAAAAGRSVLLATRSPHAAEVLTEVLQERPGPTPVAFGGAGRHLDAVGEVLHELQAWTAPGTATREQAAASRASARRRLDAATAALRSDLEVLEQVARARRAADRRPVLVAAAPAAFTLGAALAPADRAAQAATALAAGWWARRRRGRAERRLRRLLGADREVPLAVLVEAVALARAEQVAEMAERHPPVPSDRWADVDRARAALVRAQAEMARSRPSATWPGAVPGPSAAPEVLELVDALGADRATRRLRLAELDHAAVLDAFPVWVGTLADIDDLLPQVPGMFDLVVLDEASHIDLPHAAVALLRGRRAVIAGDPNQLRHVSFVADDDVDRVLARRRISHLADRLQVRRDSVLDLARRHHPTVTLDEHFRSAPHLIAFSTERFADHQVHLATRRPANDSTDVIDTVRVDGERDARGVNEAEVGAVVDLVDAARDGGYDDVGVVTPFRAQADALRRALLDRHDLDALEHLGLQVGTVHAFQGAEADLVIASLCLDDASPPGALAFAQRPDVMNVLTTRARQHLVLVTSLVDPPPGLLRELLAHAEHPPPPPPPAWPDDPWARAVLEHLAALDVTVRPGYPVGRWTLDAAVTAPGRRPDPPVAVELTVHPQGPGAHIERRTQLEALGWTVLDAWPTTHPDPARAARHLAERLRTAPRTAAAGGGAAQ